MQRVTAFRAGSSLLLLMTLLVSMPLLLACKPKDQPQATPVAGVEEFLQWRIKSNVRTQGLPTPEELAAMQPYLSTQLLELLQQAHERHPRSKRPSQKERPFLQGDLFSSVAEGPTSFNLQEAGEPETVGENEHIVPVRLWSARKTPPINWTDRVKVVMENGRYVVADVQYQDHWSFGAGTSLVEVLKRDVAGRKPARKLAQLQKR